MTTKFLLIEVSDAVAVELRRLGTPLDADLAILERAQRMHEVAPAVTHLFERFGDRWFEAYDVMKHWLCETGLDTLPEPIRIFHSGDQHKIGQFLLTLTDIKAPNGLTLRRNKRPGRCNKWRIQKSS